MTCVTYRLTAKNLDQLWNPTLGIEYVLPFSALISPTCCGYVQESERVVHEPVPGVSSGTEAEPR